MFNKPRLSNTAEYKTYQIQLRCETVGGKSVDGEIKVNVHIKYLLMANRNLFQAISRQIEQFAIYVAIL